jgi:4'-phosphopantetheinyl transferase
LEWHWNAQGEHELPEGTGWLSPAERERAARMRFTKRRSDYLLGRYTAKRAVAARVGLRDSPASLARIEIPNDPDGAPEVRIDGAPAPAAISLTDRAGWGVCVVADGDGRIGCDLELVEPRSATFVADYLTPAEQDQVARVAPGEARDELANWIWCAKESALKVLRTGLRRDTRSVEVAFARLGGVRGWRPLTVDLAEGGQLPGWGRRFGHFVLTLVADQQPTPPPPRPLRAFGVLSGAEPSHRWLAAPLVPETR